jgi:hypothetical protein
LSAVLSSGVLAKEEDLAEVEAVFAKEEALAKADTRRITQQK